jgi:hypothetical protein
VTRKLCARPSRVTPSASACPIVCADTLSTTSPPVATGWPSIWVMTSPARSPAAAAGLPGVTSEMKAPCSGAFDPSFSFSAGCSAFTSPTFTPMYA